MFKNKKKKCWNNKQDCSDGQNNFSVKLVMFKFEFLFAYIIPYKKADAADDDKKRNCENNNYIVRKWGKRCIRLFYSHQVLT